MYYITPKTSETGKKMQALLHRAAEIRKKISSNMTKLITVTVKIRNVIYHIEMEQKSTYK